MGKERAAPAPRSDTRSNISLAERALRIRRPALRMGEGQGYVGQALGVADVLAVASVKGWLS